MNLHRLFAVVERGRVFRFGEEQPALDQNAGTDRPVDPDDRLKLGAPAAGRGIGKSFAPPPEVGRSPFYLSSVEIAVCGADMARCCAIVRSRYSVASNTGLTVKSLAIFADCKDYPGIGEADSRFVMSGYLILAPQGEFADWLRANLAMRAGVGGD